MTSSADGCQSIDTEIEPQDGNNERAMSKEISKKNQNTRFMNAVATIETTAIDERC